jgi:hypothetical protein
VLALSGEWWWRGWDHVLYSIETGKTRMEKAHGTTVFEYLASQPQEASHFNEAMIGFLGAEAAAVATAYDFSGCEIIEDGGGGTGNLLTAILERHPRPRGVLADLPHVLHEALALVESHGLAYRITLEAIDFFTSVPGHGDVYLLSHVIHDWNEEQCLAILRNCRQAMRPGSRLLIRRNGPAGGRHAAPGKAARPGDARDARRAGTNRGRVRDVVEPAGFQLTRVVPTGSAVSIVEAVANHDTEG